MKNKNSLKNKKNKGVSEAIGYILTFSIVIFIVGTIYTAGIPMINDMKDTSAMQSMEASFFTLQSSIGRTAVGQSPVSVLGLNIARGGISSNRNSGSIIINYGGVPQTFNFNSIEWTLGHRRIIHELGAVIVSYDGIDGIISSEPPIFFTNGGANPHAFISIINTTGDFSAAGGFTNLNLKHDDTVVHKSLSPPSTIKISIHTQFPRAWSLFLNNSYEDAFNELPIDAGYDSNHAFLNIANSNLTLVKHNLIIS